MVVFVGFCLWDLPFCCLVRVFVFFAIIDHFLVYSGSMQWDLIYVLKLYILTRTCNCNEESEFFERWDFGRSEVDVLFVSYGFEWL